MKKLISTALLAPVVAFAQTFPAPTFSGLTLQKPLTAANGGTGTTTASGSGSVVLSNSPTLVTPNLGTPSAINLTNATGLPLSGLPQQPANTVLSNATGSTAAVTGFSMPGCSTSSSALGWTAGTGFNCNSAINAATLNGATFSAPGAIGSGTASTGAFTTLTTSGASGATSLAVNGSSTPTSNLFTLTDSVSGTMSSSFEPDSMFIYRTYNGVEGTSAYAAAGFAIHPYLGYGPNNASTSGSVALVGGQLNIYNSSNAPAGRSEFTPLAVATVPIKGGTFAPGSNYYNDFNIQTAPGTGGQEGFLAGGSFAVQKWTNGNVIDANHAGSYGLSVITTPSNIGFDPQNHASDTTYPLNAMVTLNGWSGQQSTTSTNGGATSTATAAANVGLQIGGVGGSVWGCSTCYSYIPTGIHIQDYTTAAIQIDSPNTGHTTSGVAINIAQGAGTLVVGDSIYVGTSTGGGVVQSAYSQVNAPNPSTSALTRYMDQGTIKWSVGKQTDNSFILYDAANSAGALAVSTAGLVTIGEGKGVQLNPTTFGNLTSCTGGSGAGTMAYITDASAAITSWHQQITAGGGTNKAFVTCNGSGWYAFNY